MELFKEKLEEENGLTRPTSLIACTGLVEEAGSNFMQLESLLLCDQLKKEIQSKRVFHGFKEGKIRFLPTFKYDKRSKVFDTSAKARCPAW